MIDVEVRDWLVQLSVHAHIIVGFGVTRKLAGNLGCLPTNIRSGILGGPVAFDRAGYEVPSLPTTRSVRCCVPRQY